MLPNVAASRANGGGSIIATSHIMQIEQNEQSPNILEVTETITFNNTGDEVYSGTILFSVQDPMYVRVFNATFVQMNVFNPYEGRFGVDIARNNSLNPGQAMALILDYAVLFKSDPDTDLIFEKEFLYTTNLVMIFVEPLSGYQVWGDGIELKMASSEEFAGTYISPHFDPVTAEPGEKYYIVVTKGKNPDDNNVGNYDSTIYYALIALIVLIVIAILFIFKGRRSTEPSNGSMKDMSEEDAKTRKSAGRRSKIRPGDISEFEILARKRKELVDKKGQILAGKKRLKGDYRSGKIEKEAYEDMEGKYQSKLKEINKSLSKVDSLLERQKVPGASDDIKKAASKAAEAIGKQEQELLARKQTLLSVLKNLEENHKAGEIPDEVYKELKAEYKQEAIDIMKKLDSLNQ